MDTSRLYTIHEAEEDPPDRDLTATFATSSARRFRFVLSLVLVAVGAPALLSSHRPHPHRHHHHHHHHHGRHGISDHMRGSHGATGELFAVVPCPADMRQLSLPGDDPVAAAPAAGGGSGVGCCGDGICDEAEARTTCPEDCRGDEGLDAPVITFGVIDADSRSEEHTSELQSPI